MRLVHVFALLSVALPSAMLAAKAETAYPVTYAGGTLPLDHHKAQAALGKDELVFLQHGHRIAVPAKNITELSYGTEVHRRMGASVWDVVPMMHLGETESHYIGVSWPGAQVLLKLNRTEYRQLLAALEQLTGIKAIDTNHVPTVVHYNL